MALHKGLRIAVVLSIFVAALSGIHRPAFAACTSPAGIGGTITWNGTDSVIWCDGTNWYALKNAAGSSGSAGYVQFSNGSGGFSNSGTTAGQQLFWDDTNKRLGIGTTTPSAPLTVVQSSAGPATSFYGGYVNIFSNLDADKYGLSLIRSRGTAAVPTATQSGDDFASLNFTGHTGSAYAIGAWIAGSQTGAVGTNIPSALRFATSDGTAIPVERMRISSAGNVGIGTGAPGSKLQIVSTDTAATSGSVIGSVQTQMTATPAADSSADYTGADDRIILSGTKNVTGSIRAGYAVATHSGSGTLNTAYGSLGIVDNTSSGTIAAAHGAYNYSRASSAGTITSAMGTTSTALTNHASAIVSSGYGAINAARTVLGTMTTAVGSFDAVQANAPTTVTVAQATRANLTVASGATITTAYGVLSDIINAGTVANWYGLYIPAVSGTAPTTSRYPVYVADTGNNYFAGNVGIGTASPSGTLYVKGNTVLSDDTANVTASYPLRVFSASNASGLLNLYYQNADVNGATLSLQKYKSGGNEIAAGDILGSIDFFGTTGAGNSLRAAQIRATAETGWGGTGDAPGRLTFWTSPDGTSTAVERMRIDNAGNVGIGTVTPAQRLAVNTTNTAATSGSVTTARMDLTASPAADSSATYYAHFNRADLSGSSNVTGTISSTHSYSTHSGAGTLYAGYGATSAMDNLGAGTVSNGYGAYNYARANSAGTITSGYGSYSAALTNHASTTMTTGVGAYNTAYTTLGTMTNAYGSYNIAQNSAPTTMGLAMGSREHVIVGSGSTVTSAYGVGIYLSNAGTVTNWYGLYIPALSGTAPTTSRYPVYVADTGSNYFAGNVGIGTTTPLNPLHVVGSLRVERPSAPNQFLEVALGGSSGNELTFTSSETSKKGFFLSSLHGGQGSATGALDFIFRVGNSASPTEVMRIKENGNVGIGTTTPAAKLDVNGFMRLAKNGSAPATCDATIDGAIALTSARRMCVCDATSWKEVNSATACTW